jgi:hypothetical protein
MPPQSVAILACSTYGSGGQQKWGRGTGDAARGSTRLVLHKRPAVVPHRHARRDAVQLARVGFAAGVRLRDMHREFVCAGPIIGMCYVRGEVLMVADVESH